jgi:hypothetical protein
MCMDNQAKPAGTTKPVPVQHCMCMTTRGHTHTPSQPARRPCSQPTCTGAQLRSCPLWNRAASARGQPSRPPPAAP